MRLYVFLYFQWFFSGSKPFLELTLTWKVTMLPYNVLFSLRPVFGIPSTDTAA